MTPGMPRGPYAMSDEMVSVARWPLDIWATPWSAGGGAGCGRWWVMGAWGKAAKLEAAAGVQRVEQLVQARMGCVGA